MEIAKPHIDVGLFAKEVPSHLAFWSESARLRYDHMQKLGGGIWQHRFHMNLET